MTHHGAALRRLVQDDSLVQSLALNWRNAGLSSQDRALCGFAESLTLHPAASGDAVVIELRQVGFADRAVLDATQIIAYFNFVNRIALGLGVELESYWKEEEILGSR
jgi:uncharacterized peroxidase-related enzyme